MPEVVRVGSVESSQTLQTTIEEYFKQGKYDAIMQAIGMYSILIDKNRTIEDQRRLYGTVLSLLKNRIAGALGRAYSAWYADFPKLLDGLVAQGQVVTDKMSAEVLASHRAAFGHFRSADDFYFWALDDRRLTLEQIVRYFEKTVQVYGK